MASVIHIHNTWCTGIVLLLNTLEINRRNKEILYLGMSHVHHEDVNSSSCVGVLSLYYLCSLIKCQFELSCWFQMRELSFAELISMNIIYVHLFKAKGMFQISVHHIIFHDKYYLNFTYPHRSSISTHEIDMTHWHKRCLIHDQLHSIYSIQHIFAVVIWKYVTWELLLIVTNLLDIYRRIYLF
jgi:hypothetical protein